MAHHNRAPIRILTLLLLSGALCGCLYANVRYPLDTDVSVTTLGAKSGRASTYAVLGLVAWGDGGVEAAARNGRLTTIRHLDVEREVILFGAWIRITTIAYGD